MNMVEWTLQGVVVLLLCLALPFVWRLDRRLATLRRERPALESGTAELGEAADNPANDIEFMLYHSDNVEASGFVQHLKLPHYVDFQANLELLRRLRAAQGEPAAQASQADPGAPSQPQPSPSQEESLA